MRNKLFAFAHGMISLSWCIAGFSLFVAVTANGTLSASTTPQISIGLQTSPDLNGFAGGKGTSSNSVKAKFIMDNGESIEVESKDDIPIDWDKYKEMPVAKCFIYDNEITIVSEKNNKGELTIKCKCIPLKLKQIFHEDSSKNTSHEIVATTIVFYCTLRGLWGGVMGVWTLHEDKPTLSFWSPEMSDEYVASFGRGFLSGVGEIFPEVKAVLIASCVASAVDEVANLYKTVQWKEFTITSFWGFVSFCQKNFKPSDYGNITGGILGCAGIF